MKKVLFLLLASSIFIFSCKKGGSDSPEPGANVEVYVAGQELSYSQVWKNGDPMFQNSAAVAPGAAYDVAVKDGDVFVAGNIQNRAAYWKNGEKLLLGNENMDSKANSIFLSGNNVFVGGTEGGLAGYWTKSGAFAHLFPYYGPSECLDIKEANTFVHCVGSFNQLATYWTGTGDTIVLANSNSVANALALSGDDVHIVGRTESEGAFYWKNGTMTFLTGTATDAKGLVVSNGDVYIAGSDLDNAVYWKNGEQVVLEKGVATGIQVINGDVYVSGHIGGNDPVAVYWKNGVKHTIRPSNGMFYDRKGNSIAIVIK